MKEITLKVVEAPPQDVRSGRVRLSEKVAAELDISYGSIVEIEGSKRTGAVVWRAHPIDEGKGIIRIDNFTRKNAGIEIGDKVIVRKIVPKTAKKVVMAPAISQGQKIQFRQDIEHLVKRGLLKRPVSMGDTIVIPGIALFGNSLPFSVCYTKPRGIVAITGETNVVVNKEPVEYPFQVSGKDEIKILEKFIKENPKLDKNVIVAIQQLIPIIKRLKEVRKDAERIKKDSIDLCTRMDMLLETLDYPEDDKDE
ncbi:MAG: hypothetical protein U9O96_01050 [Candidatus Thermoplasmatota archaeon]|nr:hypothetical protein [Candidatus Thermoplasmatota archaeon]